MQYVYIIYKLVFPNKKIYVGQTIQNFNQRMCQYNSDAYNENSKRYSVLISKSIRKYGWDNVKQEIICTVSEEFVDDAEKYFIKNYNSLVENGQGYNIEDGGCKNKIGCWKGKKRLGFCGKNHPFYNKKRPEHSKRMSGENNPMWGKDISEEIKQKIRNAKLGKKQSKEQIQNATKTRYKPVICYYLNNNFTKKFESSKQASKELNIDSSSICKVLKNKQKSAGGYTFKYLIVDA